jgi:hypothetical protein
MGSIEGDFDTSVKMIEEKAKENIGRTQLPAKRKMKI